MPRVKSFAELNIHLRQYCLEYLNHKIANRPQKVGEMLCVEQQFMTILPEKRFDPAIVKSAKVNSSALIRYRLDNSYYSVPASLTGKMLTVKAYALRIEVWHKGFQVATHKRTYKQSHVSYQLEHYLPVLEVKTRAARDATPVKQTIDSRIRSFGEKLNDKDYVALLKLSVDYGQKSVLAAIAKAKRGNKHTYESVRFELLQSQNPKIYDFPICVNTEFPKVKSVNLNEYDLLLKGAQAND